MSALPETIPIAIANILVAYFCHTATLAQQDQLDEWICESDSNMMVFEAFLETSLLPVVPDSDRDQEFEPAQEVHLN